MPLDIGVGILLSIGVAEIFGIPLTPALVAFGIAAALLPDIDIVTALFGRWRHRSYTHYPLLYVPVFILGYFFLPLPFLALLILGVLAHLIHDTIGTGWGIAWLWPFSQRRFLFLPDGSRAVPVESGVSWLPKEKPEYVHTGSHWTWIRDLYFRPNAVAYVEYGVFLLSLAVLLIYVRLGVG